MNSINEFILAGYATFSEQAPSLLTELVPVQVPVLLHNSLEVGKDFMLFQGTS